MRTRTFLSTVLSVTAVTLMTVSSLPASATQPARPPIPVGGIQVSPGNSRTYATDHPITRTE